VVVDPRLGSSAATSRNLHRESRCTLVFLSYLVSKLPYDLHRQVRLLCGHGCAYIALLNNLSVRSVLFSSCQKSNKRVGERTHWGVKRAANTANAGNNSGHDKGRERQRHRATKLAIDEDEGRGNRGGRLSRKS
jgi:hypothetical protein